MLTSINEISFTRRQSLVGLLALGCSEVCSAKQPIPRSSLGLLIYARSIRRRWQQQHDSRQDLFEPLTFLRHCREVGASGMQATLGVLTPEQMKALRNEVEEHAMFLEGIVNFPKTERDLDRFEAEIRSAAAVKAPVVRTVLIPGRRYEQFKTLKEYREAVKQAQIMLERVRPIVEKHRVGLAIENHKDQRLEERLELLKSAKSEYVGVCVDTGNNLALLEDPYDTIEALAPFALTVHLKDQALQGTDDGFLLGDIPLGQGCLDLPRIIKRLRQARANIRFHLEIITRDPLRVPCLADAYWETLPEVPARDLARMMRFVRQHRANELQYVSSLSLEKQVAREDANIAASLNFAREKLNF